MQDVNEFVSSSENIWRNLALHHLFTIGSSTVNGCRQNEKHENITIIHTSPVHKLMYCEVKSCMLVRNKFIFVRSRFLSWFKQDDFFTGESNIMDYVIGRSNGLKLKSSWWLCFLQTHSFLIDDLELCGLLVDHCDVFISCLDSHSDGTHSLAEDPLVSK